MEDIAAAAAAAATKDHYSRERCFCAAFLLLFLVASGFDSRTIIMAIHVVIFLLLSTFSFPTITATMVIIMVGILLGIAMVRVVAE